MEQEKTKQSLIAALVLMFLIIVAVSMCSRPSSNNLRSSNDDAISTEAAMSLYADMFCAVMKNKDYGCTVDASSKQITASTSEITGYEFSGIDDATVNAYAHQNFCGQIHEGSFPLPGWAIILRGSETRRELTRCKL